MTTAVIARHKTAMSRTFLSRPVQQAHEDGLVTPATTFFDYGCGRGDDIRLLGKLGLSASGWDPGHAPEEPLVSADVVNLGYVINVIEDIAERRDVLKAAWKLAESVLIVSGRLDWDPDAGNGKPYADGILTSTGTFQKYYSPEELKAFIESTLGEQAITALPGTYYIFRNNSSAQAMLARASRRTSRPRQGIAELLYTEQLDVLAPIEAWVEEHRKLPSVADIAGGELAVDAFGSIRSAFAVIRRATDTSRWIGVDLGTTKKSEQRFAEHLDDLQPLIDFVTERGRLPRTGELENEEALQEHFKSVRAAFSLIRRVTGADKWTEFEEEARHNFLVYCALSAFGGRPKMSDLPEDLQFDAKDLFGSYKNACIEADKLLYSIADMPKISAEIGRSEIGKKTPEALYVHVSAVDRLAPVLRVYQGAARTLTGNVDDASVIKMHRLKPQVSFLIYPDFDTDPHPAAEASVVARLGELRASFKNFAGQKNPAILHRKETFVAQDHPLYQKFARLTRQEEKAGLLNSSSIGRREQWDEALAEAGYKLSGHRLLKA